MDKRELDEILLDDDMRGSDRVRGHPSVVCVHPFVGRTVSPAQEGTGRNGPSFCHRCCSNAERFRFAVFSLAIPSLLLLTGMHRSEGF